MNPRIKHLILFLVFGALTVASQLLWQLPPQGSSLVLALGIFTLVLGLVALHWFIKMIFPKYNILTFLAEIFTGF